MKVFFCLIVFSSSAFAFEFRMSSEQKFYISDGRPAPGGTYSVLRASLIQDSTGNYSSARSLKVFSATGKELFTHTSPVEILSDDEVEILNGFFAGCKAPVEKIALKAGIFEACRVVSPGITSWFVDRFPFAVKQIIVDENGFSVSEATEVLSRY